MLSWCLIQWGRRHASAAIGLSRPSPAACVCKLSRIRWSTAAPLDALTVPFPGPSLHCSAVFAWMPSRAVRTTVATDLVEGETRPLSAAALAKVAPNGPACPIDRALTSSRRGWRRFASPAGERSGALVCSSVLIPAGRRRSPRRRRRPSALVRLRLGSSASRSAPRSRWFCVLTRASDRHVDPIHTGGPVDRGVVAVARRMA